MATGRKGPSAPSSRKRSSTPPEAVLPGDDGDDDLAPAAGPPPDDLVAVVRGLAAAVAEHGLSELIVDTPEVTFTLRRGAAQVSVPVASLGQIQTVPMQTVSMPSIPSMPSISLPSAPNLVPVGTQPSGVLQVPPVAPPPEEKAHLVTSPFVGTFYRRPNPDAAEYVKVNDKVAKGQVLCIVEAMKLMNEIEADIAGTIVGVLAEDGAPVEYGQPLFKIA
jgi:acetyl-CoA carboxylase biotin carboxyl carrier protein